MTPSRVFLTTLLNPKAILFALGVVPFGAERVWPYRAGFAGLRALVALGWIGFGALAGRAAAATGRGHTIPRIAAVVAGFAAQLLTSPLLR
ncbi:hypothetical protein [Ancylobacter defluvii]|uniref:hypothetical protein n=1 Tax=Ancylobacter defluvii TaxID=1282440 RepID=UPI001BCFAA62|nr:hypothetical protein [Ancylobacter defluvii]MBS7589325.1 hypothetical protein [Ancylobacter defluvii]